MKEAVFILQVLAFLVPGIRERSVRVFGKTLGVHNLANNPHFSERSRHIDVYNHFLRKLAADGGIEVNYVET